MGFRILNQRDSKWQPRKGLEGPFFYPNGLVLYYVSNEEMDTINQQFYTALAA